ncbi:MAG: hypothetical protein R2682_15380 [Pyrinomonadaceae bacterium]
MPLLLTVLKKEEEEIAVVIGLVDLCKKRLTPYKIESFLSTKACGKLVENILNVWKITHLSVFLKFGKAFRAAPCVKSLLFTINA